jgi:hypothetical protein
VGLLLALAWGDPTELLAQGPEPDGNAPALDGSIGIFLRGTRVIETTEAMAGGEASLHFFEHLSFGAAGGGLLQAAPVAESAADVGTELTMGYGGLLVGYESGGRGGVTWAARALLGAGHASIRALPVGNELGADNFLVLEPEIQLRVRTFGAMYLALSVGHRLVGAVQDLPTLGGDDLEGTSFTVLVLIR